MKKKLLTIVLAIVISLSIVLLKNNFSQLLPNKQFGITGLKDNQTIDNLFIGSSMFKQGIDPNCISDNDYIVAYNGNEPTNIYEELMYLLSRNIEIKNLYIDMYAWTIIRGPWIDDIKILWDTDIRTINNIFNSFNEPSLIYTYEYYISSNNDFLLSYPISTNILNNYYLKGGNNYNSAHASKEYLDSLDLNASGYNEISPDEAQIEAIINIKELCTKNSINLCFIETPKYYREMNWDNYKIVMEQYEKILTNNNIKYILSKEIDFDNEDNKNFSDLLHMSSIGCKEYTSKLVKLLGQ